NEIALPGDHGGRGEMHGLLARPALPVDRRAGYRFRPSGRGCRAARDVPRLLADLRHTAPDHVVDVGRVGADPVGEWGEQLAGKVDRVDAGQSAAALADRGPGGTDNHRVTHGYSPVAPTMPPMLLGPGGRRLTRDSAPSPSRPRGSGGDQCPSARPYRR